MKGKMKRNDKIIDKNSTVVSKTYIYIYISGFISDLGAIYFK